MAKRRPLDLNVALDATAYYIFNIGKGEGYVIVSGSDLAPEVLAYVDRGSFIQESIPINMENWLNDYAAQIACLERTSTTNVKPRLAIQRNAVNPLLTSTWGQNSPYNDMCPVNSSTGVHCATGCVATALAQVINYHKHPKQTMAAIPSYTTESLSIKMPEIGINAIEWNNILDNYTGEETTAQKEAVAKLMLLCGQAVEMDYNTPESGISTSDIPLDVKALIRFFGYDTTVRSINRNYFEASEWESIIYTEVAEGRPVLYNGLSSGGGHAFVIDGYSSDGLFHVNWGWEGVSDGYFALSILNPYNNSSTGASSSLDGYSIGQNAIIGIQHGTEETIAERFEVTDIKNTGSTSYSRSSTSEDFTGISIQPTVLNLTGDSHAFLLGITLVDANDKWVTDVIDSISYGSLDFKFGGPYNFENCSFGAGLSDGDYYIIPVSASENSQIWEPCWRANVYRIKATINGNNLTLTEPTISLSGLIQPIGATVVGHTLPLSAQIVNNGSYFNDYVYLFVNNEDGMRLEGGRIFEAQEDESANFDINFVPMSTGRKTIYLAYDSGSQYNFFAMGTVMVAEDNSKLESEISLVNGSEGIVPDNKVLVKVRITNRNDNYDESVGVVLYKYNEDDKNYYAMDAQTQHIFLESGATTTISPTFEGLEYGQQYLLDFKFRKAGRWKDENYIIFKCSNTIELTVTPDSGEVLKGSYVVLNAMPKSAKIYYTLDGTNPSANSPAYNSPILIDKDMTIQAMAIKDGFIQSDLCTQTYTVVDNERTNLEDIGIAMVDNSGNKSNFKLTDIESITIDYADTEPPVVQVEKVSSNGCNLTLRYTMPENVDCYYSNLANNVSANGRAYTTSCDITYTWLKPSTTYYVSTLAIGKNGRKGDVITKNVTTSPAPYTNYTLYRNNFYQISSARRVTQNSYYFLYLYINSSDYVVFRSTSSTSWGAGTYNITSSGRYIGGLSLSGNKIKWGEGKLTISGSGSNTTIDFDLDTGGEVYITGHYNGKVQ